MEVGYRRLAPGQPVGLRHTGYVIALEDVIKVLAGAHIDIIWKGEETGHDNALIMEYPVYSLHVSHVTKFSIT